MKASERLRHLSDGWPQYEYTAQEVMAALPLIADVVEAAEKEHALIHPGGTMQMLDGSWQPCSVCSSLTALRDALQPPLGSEPLGVEGFRELIEAGDVQTLRERLAEEGSPPPPEGATAP